MSAAFKKALRRTSTLCSNDSQELKSPKAQTGARTATGLLRMNSPRRDNDNGEVFVYDMGRNQTLKMPKKELFDKIGDHPTTLQRIPISSSTVPVYLGNENYQEWFASVHIPASVRLQRKLSHNSNFDTLYVTCF